MYVCDVYVYVRIIRSGIILVAGGTQVGSNSRTRSVRPCVRACVTRRKNRKIELKNEKSWKESYTFQW